MKTQERMNPIPIKTYNPNFEPWLNDLEALFEVEALQNGINKMTGGIENGE